MQPEIKTSLFCKKLDFVEGFEMPSASLSSSAVPEWLLHEVAAGNVIRCPTTGGLRIKEYQSWFLYEPGDMILYEKGRVRGYKRQAFDRFFIALNTPRKGNIGQSEGSIDKINPNRKDK